LARALDAELYCPSPASRAWPAPVRYCVQAVRTAFHIARTRPTDILFTNPPAVAGVVLILVARLFRARVWADSHSGAFNDPRWMRFSRLNDWVLSKCAGAIVTNTPLAERVNSRGGHPFILNLVSEGPAARVEDRTETLLAPLSYSFDEPVRELLAAVASVPEAHVTLTGQAPSWVVRSAPRNCTVTGWLATGEYERVLSRASGVICLTTRDLTMQMGAYEALEHGLPILASGTSVLREYLSQGGAAFVDDHEPAILAEAIRRFWRMRDQLIREAEAAQRAMFERARLELSELEAALSTESRDGRGPSDDRAPLVNAG
jgi:glycosyltransferase involved in cell wall biosynthesis